MRNFETNSTVLLKTCYFIYFFLKICFFKKIVWQFLKNVVRNYVTTKKKSDSSARKKATLAKKPVLFARKPVTSAIFC